MWLLRLAPRAVVPGLVALLLAALAIPAAAQPTPSADFTLYPPNLHLAAGQTSSVPLTVRDRNGNPVAGTVTFSGFDASLIAIAANGFVTALRAEAPAERGTWVTATIDGARVGNNAVVRVLSTPRTEVFAYLTRPNTALYYPTAIGADGLTSLVNRYQVAEVNEYAYLTQRRLMNTVPFGGARQVFAVDFGENEAQRVCGISGNPTRIGWNVAGTVWQNCFMVPFISPRSPVWFVWHHELANDFTGHARSFTRGLAAFGPYLEGIASALAYTQLEMNLRTPLAYPMNADAAASVTQQLVQYHTIFTGAFQTWVSQGAGVARLNDENVPGLFLHYKNQRGDFAQRFFTLLRPEYHAQLTPIFDLMGPSDQHTIFAAMVSAAAGQNLGAVFVGTYGYPANVALFESALAAFNQILATLGPPAAPTGLVGSAVGSTVTLSWLPADTGGPAATYIIDAGSAPGQSNLGSFPTGNPGATFTATNIGDGRYYVRVRAANASGASSPSNEATFRVGYLPPDPPTSLVASASGATVTLAWTAPAAGDAPTSYTIEAGSRPGLSDLARISTGTTATSFVTGGVPAGQYYVRVRAANPGGQSPASNEAALGVACSAPAAPGNLRGSGSPGGAVSLAWDAVSGALSYQLDAGAQPGSSNLGSFNMGGNTTFATSGVARGTYYLRVHARNACGWSTASNEFTLQVP